MSAHAQHPLAESGILYVDPGLADRITNDTMVMHPAFTGHPELSGEEHVYLSTDGDEFIVTEDGNVDGPAGPILEKLTTAYRRLCFHEICQETIAAEIGLEPLAA